MYVINKL